MVNTSAYVPANTTWNQVQSGGWAVVNLLVGERTTLKAEFVRYHTFCPEVPLVPKITICDIDRYLPGENEVYFLDGVSAIYTVDDDIDYDLK
eukprot:4547524-Pyramimonas_sp.AAC.1